MLWPLTKYPAFNFLLVSSCICILVTIPPWLLSQLLPSKACLVITRESQMLQQMAVLKIQRSSQFFSTWSPLSISGFTYSWGQYWPQRHFLKAALFVHRAVTSAVVVIDAAFFAVATATEEAAMAWLMFRHWYYEHFCLICYSFILLYKSLKCAPIWIFSMMLNSKYQQKVPSYLPPTRKHQ